MSHALPMLFDAHVHLQAYPDELLPKALTRARRVGVTRFGCCGTNASDWDRVMQIASNNSGVEASYGLHPWYVANPGNSNWLEHLEALLQVDPTAGIGEIGLDAIRPDRELQMTVFTAQLDLAKKYGRRISLHCVKAGSDIVAVLKKHHQHLSEILVHGPSFSADIWQQFNRLGVSVSIGPQVLNPRATKVRELARLVPEEKLFYETDAPDGAVAGCAVAELNGLNAPENIPRIMAEVQRIRREA